MSPDEKLPPEWKLAIREYTGSYIARIGTALGIANIAVLIGALYFLVGQAANEAVTEEVNDLNLKESISETLVDIGEVRGQLLSAQSDIDLLEQQYSQVQARLQDVVVSDDRSIELATNLISTVAENTDVSETIDGLVESSKSAEWSNLGVMGRIQAQASCTAITDSRGLSGWVTAVVRQCGENLPTCDQICARVSTSQDGQLSSARNHRAISALHIYGNEPRSDTNIAGLKTYSYGQGGTSANGCGPNYCCCLSQ